jgi:O-antigen ligase
MKTAIKLCLWLLAFVPLIVDWNVFFPDISGKNLLIQSCLVLAGILFLANFLYSADFRKELMEKVTRYLHHPLTLSILAFLVIFIVSIFFAVDKSIAFWGELSRAEGLSGMIFFLSFFIFSLLIFEKKDWIWFFRFSLFVSAILLSKEFVEFFYNNIPRPESYIGNPTFLAGYLLFSVASAVIVIGSQNEILDHKKKYVPVFKTFFGVFSIVVIVLSTLGIFITQTRGTILGLGLGIIIILIYCAIKGKDIFYKKINLRTVSIILLCLGIVFSGVFIATRKNEIWQKVPGLSRVAVLGDNDKEDPSSAIRSFLYKSSLQSVNPVQNGWGKLLVGWGPDNFIIADSKYYYGEQYKYENRWYDRTHNKLLDVLVMNGIFGLLTYLAVWFTFFKFLFKKSAPRSLGEVGLDIGLLFFGISFLTHLMFVFDQISTSIPFFAILAFVTYLTAKTPTEEPKKTQIAPEINGKSEILASTFLVILTVFLTFIYFKSTLPGYIQMRDYTHFIKNTQTISFESKIDSVFSPFTLAQTNIRRNFLEVVADMYVKNPNELNGILLKKAINKAEEYIQMRPSDFGFLTTLADIYNYKGNLLRNMESLKKGEGYFRKVLEFSPNRPDINRGLGLNLYYQGKYTDSFRSFERGFDLSPSYFNQDKVTVEGIYTKFIQYFYEQRDKENFVKTADRLRVNNYANMAPLDQIIQYLNTNATWPIVDFK